MAVRVEALWTARRTMRVMKALKVLGSASTTTLPDASPMGPPRNVGLVRCTVEDGCGNTALGCQGEEDCVSSTLEAGWDVDLEVSCVNGICDAPY